MIRSPEVALHVMRLGVEEGVWNTSKREGREFDRRGWIFDGKLGRTLALSLRRFNSKFISPRFGKSRVTGGESKFKV